MDRDTAILLRYINPKASVHAPLYMDITFI